MDKLEELREDSDGDRIINCSEQCVLEFLCAHCGTKIETLENKLPKIEYPLKKRNNNVIIKDDKCPYCKEKLSKCSVCSCPIRLSKKSNNECLVFCNKCSHGGHYEHYKVWFQEFNECPNSKCNCRCQEEGYKGF